MQPYASYRIAAAALSRKAKPKALRILFTPKKLISFSSVDNRKPLYSFENEIKEEKEKGSEIYKHTLKFQRPTIAKYQNHLYNSATFIGSVDSPLKIFQSSDDNDDSSLRVITKLRVTDFGVQSRYRHSDRDRRPALLWILVEMRGELAEISRTHVKEQDFLCVAGRLDCFTKTTGDGKQKTHYKVVAKELNFVAEHPRLITNQDCRKSHLGRGIAYGDDADLEQPKNPLHLWQVFFSSPLEWWDNRHVKKNLRQPDFKHKDTGEALWMRADDPPWVKKQLQLLDSKMSTGLGAHLQSRYRVSALEYDE